METPRKTDEQELSFADLARRGKKRLLLAVLASVAYCVCVTVACLCATPALFRKLEEADAAQYLALGQMCGLMAGLAVVFLWAAAAPTNAFGRVVAYGIVITAFVVATGWLFAEASDGPLLSDYVFLPLPIGVIAGIATWIALGPPRGDWRRSVGPEQEKQ